MCVHVFKLFSITDWISIFTKGISRASKASLHGMYANTAGRKQHKNAQLNLPLIPAFVI